MKKHYIRAAIIIDILILAVFVLGTGFYTYIMAVQEMQKHMQSVKDSVYLNEPGSYTDRTEQDLICDTYTSFWDMHNATLHKDTGFYGYLKLNDGTVFDTSTSYCYLINSEDNYIDNDEIRIFTMEGDIPFDTNRVYDLTFDAECDDVFINGGTLTTNQGQTYQIADNGYTSSRTIPVSEWIGDNEVVCNVVRFAKTDLDASLNAEAKALFEDLTSRDTIIDLSKEDIFTSYSMSLVWTEHGVYATMQVFHPVDIIIRDNIGAYIIILIALIFIEIMVAVSMYRICKNRMEYEMRSRRLTRGVAHELKTPLAVTKAYMDNWDMLSEEDRTKYAEMVGREIDDMSDLITTLLEMDKIDSGKIKLNLEEVEISSLISSVYKRVKPLADERKLEVKIDTDKEYVIKADLRLMKIAISNYLTNMVKYADKEAKVDIWMNGSKVLVQFKNDSTNDRKSNTDKLSSNGMGIEINENIMKLHGFKSGSNLREYETVYWFEAEKV